MDENNAIFQQFLLKSRQRRRKRTFYFEEEDNFFDEDVQQDDMLNHIATLAGVHGKQTTRVKFVLRIKIVKQGSITGTIFTARKLMMSSRTIFVFHMQHAMGSTYPPTDKFEAVSHITGQAACSVFVPPRSWRITFRFTCDGRWGGGGVVQAGQIQKYERIVPFNFFLSLLYLIVLIILYYIFCSFLMWSKQSPYLSSNCLLLSDSFLRI